MATTAAPRKTKAQLMEEKFVLACTETGQFPAFDEGPVCARQLTMSLGNTHIFDGRDNPAQKLAYYNALYKGVATFRVLNF